ncbi:hypothetical protein FRC0337_01869 [Corynebacterium diphtheriae]|nr:hypothetical protein CDIPH_09320 [Corynebacterium diphtheriae]CAB0518460.1 hypothetical protein CIP103987_01700 [Corynebacterium diphtheriae]CAB0519915.1 hypothetical protein FRC061569_01756 [Corynebacterium diphtheriae]CAB0520756.1 hypothetical protein CIP101280_01826 [Corynebacterium diphtheriae]CAB0520951.1 hypothetical protein CIP102550_01797 [Corynebacterium diphtheriae]
MLTCIFVRHMTVNSGVDVAVLEFAGNMLEGTYMCSDLLKVPVLFGGFFRGSDDVGGA